MSRPVGVPQGNAGTAETLARAVAAETLARAIHFGDQCVGIIWWGVPRRF